MEFENYNICSTPFSREDEGIFRSLQYGYFLHPIVTFSANSPGKTETKPSHQPFVPSIRFVVIISPSQHPLPRQIDFSLRRAVDAALADAYRETVGI